MTGRPIIFGTDGWRGLMDGECSEATMSMVAEAFVHYLHEKNFKQPFVAIGFDGRKNSRSFANAIGRILACHGVRVLLSADVVPTPVLSFTTKANKCSAGIMVTASHNPPEYNGVKFKGIHGGPFLSEETSLVESFLGRPVQAPEFEPTAFHDVIAVADFLPPYISHLKTIVDFSLLRSFAENPHKKASVLIDSMGGAGQTILEDILVGCGWRAQTLFGEPDPGFFDRLPEPISKNLEPLKYNVSVTDAQLEIATDGDADRCGIVYDDGVWMNAQDTILALLWHIHEHKAWKGTIVKTASVTDKVQLLAELWNTPFREVQVGFKYVSEAMLREDCMFGGEESGGFGFGMHLPERDGILSGLLFAEMLAVTGISLREMVNMLREKVGDLHYARIDMPWPSPPGSGLLELCARRFPKAVENWNQPKLVEYCEKGVLNGIKLHFGDSRWLLVRTSQTEPIVRFYAEGSSDEEVDFLLSEAKKTLA